MNLNYTLTSKRRCLKLVRENIVSGWDDPRMSTLCGMRRRGYTPEAIRDFCERIGVSKANSVVDFALLEACIREDLNKKAPRAMAVLRPIKLIIDNYPEDKVEQIEVEVNPENPEMGKRTVEFSRELYIEEDDETETYKLVTSIRGNSLEGKISTESPLGKAILGKKQGDRVLVKVNDNYGYYVVIKAIDKSTNDAEDDIRKF